MFTKPEHDDVEVPSTPDGRQLRLRCLEMASSAGGPSSDILDLAEEMYDFVVGSKEPPKPHLVQG